MASAADLAKAAFDALERGDPDAPAKFGRAIEADPRNGSLILGEAEALMIAGAKAPAERLSATLERYPQWADGQRALAALLWELGSTSDYAASFKSAVRDHPGNAELWNAYLQTLAGVGDYAAAADAAAEARRYFSDPVLTLIEANNRGMVGEDETVEVLLATVPASRGRDEVEVRHRIRLGEWDAARQLVDRLVSSPEADVGSWALAEVVWRKTSDGRWQWLAGAPQFIAKEGLSYSAEELDALAATLEALHSHRRQPIGQSVRGGTQTRGRLLDRKDEVLAAFRKRLEEAVENYRKRLPPHDPTHPLLRHRDRDLKIEGSWSVRLSSAGFHVPHFHFAGVLSSAFYVRVPRLDQSTQEGWLELGRPPPDLQMDLEPLATIEPEPGRLVLFPSYLYHGTRLFSAGERLSVAFDVS
jgi:tetratricopeptide (TPR) repeat protein